MATLKPKVRASTTKHLCLVLHSGVPKVQSRGSWSLQFCPQIVQTQHPGRLYTLHPIDRGEFSRDCFQEPQVLALVLFNSTTDAFKVLIYRIIVTVNKMDVPDTPKSV